MMVYNLPCQSFQVTANTSKVISLPDTVQEGGKALRTELGAVGQGLSDTLSNKACLLVQSAEQLEETKTWTALNLPYCRPMTQNVLLY